MSFWDNSISILFSSDFFEQFFLIFAPPELRKLFVAKVNGRKISYYKATRENSKRCINFCILFKFFLHKVFF